MIWLSGLAYSPIIIAMYKPASPLNVSCDDSRFDIHKGKTARALNARTANAILSALAAPTEVPSPSSYFMGKTHSFKATNTWKRAASSSFTAAHNLGGQSPCGGPPKIPASINDTPVPLKCPSIRLTVSGLTASQSTNVTCFPEIAPFLSCKAARNSVANLSAMPSGTMLST